MEVFEVDNCPNTELAKTNRALLNPASSFAKQGIEHIAVREAPKGREAFIFSVDYTNLVGPQKIGFNLTGRKWAKLLKGNRIEVAPYLFDGDKQDLKTITFLVDFNTRSNAPNVEFNVEEMSKQFSLLFQNQAFTKDQLFAFVFNSNNIKTTFELTVKEIKAEIEEILPEIGRTTEKTKFLFEKGEGSTVKLVGGSASTVPRPVINQNWDFAAMGVGGLSEQFNTIFRRAFATRLLPPDVAEKVKAKFVKGILLYGPPGTGKTLIARQIGKMLLSREPKIVNGPEILNKYVGESEANIRKLFLEAEEEYQKAGANSGLHVIIFDEIDALCKARGNSASSAGVGDNVVNQLLTKIDGVEALPNVLLIGMTNRRDLIDEALLRPGRLDLQIEIGLPNVQGRLEILKIHTTELRNNNIIDPSVSLEELAEKTKNYTGAEIEGLVLAARDIAVNRAIKVSDKVEIKKNVLDDIRISRADFEYSMEHEIKPALGTSDVEMSAYKGPIIAFDPAVATIQEEFVKIISEVKDNPSEEPYFVLLMGDRGSGLTTLAANLALLSGFPFTRFYQAHLTAGEPDSTKIQHQKKLFSDASRSEQSCIIIDDLCRIVNYSHIGPQFSINVLNSLVSMKNKALPHGRKMLVVVTCYNISAMDVFQISDSFDTIIQVPSLSRPDQVQVVLDYLIESGDSPFTTSQCNELTDALGSLPFKMPIKRVHQILRRVDKVKPDQRVKEFLQKMHQLKLVVRSRALVL